MGFALKKEHLPHYTYSDYELWEGNWELIHGIPYSMSPTPNFIHQSVNTSILVQLADKLKHCKTCTAIMPLDWIIADDTVVQPDVMIICKEVKEKFLTFPPTVIFEILSPSTAQKDKTLKFDLYESQGVKYYVIVDIAAKSAIVYEYINDKYTKVLETGNESFTFDLEVCSAEFSFEKIW